MILFLSSFRRTADRLLIAAISAVSLVACVSTNVKSSVVSPQHAPVERVFVLLPPAQFPVENQATINGNVALNKLAPTLKNRLAADLNQKGLQARSWSQGSVPLAEEKILTLRPVSFSLNPSTGEKMIFRATLQDGLNQTPFWTAEITMRTFGMAGWGDGVADDIASQLIERLRADQLLHDAPK